MSLTSSAISFKAFCVAIPCLVNYVCKVEDGIDKQLEMSRYLYKYGLDYDIYADSKDADYDIPILSIISDKVEKQNKKN